MRLEVNPWRNGSGWLTPKVSRGSRKPGDPARFPEACARCSGHYPTAAVWPDGRVCGYCYQAAKRCTGRWACGHEGVLPGRITGRPACRRCSGVRLNVDCLCCGEEGELHSGGRCWRCTLTEVVEEVLTNPETGFIDPSLRPLVVALAEMPRPNSGLTWLRQPHVTAFLKQLAVATKTSHEELDAMPASRTREHVRGLLVEHGVLPRRDERVARFRAWSDTALTRLPDGPDRDVVQRYIRWQLLRRMNQVDTVSESTFLRAKQNVTVAIDLINWLQSDRGKSFIQVDQADLDAWQADGPSTSEFAGRFLAWAVKSRIVPRGLQMTPHQRGTAPKLAALEQQYLIENLITTPGGLSPRDKLIAILVMVFGQSVERIASLTWDQVVVSDDLVTIRLGNHAIALPPPLDEPVRHLARIPVHANTAAHPHSPWVFRGTKPGQHSSPAALRLRLSKTFASRAARLGTLHELAKTTPIAILADGLGYSPATLERLGVEAGQNFARYVAVPRISSVERPGA